MPLLGYILVHDLRNVDGICVTVVIVNNQITQHMLLMVLLTFVFVMLPEIC